MVGENDPSTQDTANNVTDEDGLMELFDQFFRLMSLMSDCLEPDSIIISEASHEGKSTTYQVTIQNITTRALLDTGANLSLFFQRNSSGHYCKYLNC